MATAAFLHLRRIQSRLLPEVPSIQFKLTFCSCPPRSQNLLLVCQPMACRPFLGCHTFHEPQLQLLVLLNLSMCPLLNEVSCFVTLIWSSNMSNKWLPYRWSVGLGFRHAH